MKPYVFDRIAQLEREHTTFAIATVVARRAPVSSHLGDRALVFADGRMEGFVGGSCSRDIIRRQALDAIQKRRPVLVQIRNASSLETDEFCGTDGDDVQNEPGAAATERVRIPMSCASEGAVDVYIEPHVPLPRLIVVGFTPIAQAVAQVASALDYAVVRVVVNGEMRDVCIEADMVVLELSELRVFLTELDAGERSAVVAIVASQGHYDELALEVLSSFDCAFLGLVASRRRAANVFGVLAQQGVAADRLAMIRNPVGLAIGARSAGDVAVSILAEIISNAPRPNTGDDREAAAFAASETAVDPICGMDVTPAAALYRTDYAGQTFFFCCAGCRASFLAEPARYSIALGKA